MPHGPHPDQKTKDTIHSSVMLQTNLLKDTRRKTKEKEKLERMYAKKVQAKKPPESRGISQTSQSTEGRRVTPDDEKYTNERIVEFFSEVRDKVFIDEASL